MIKKHRVGEDAIIAIITQGRMRLATKIHERCNATLTIAEISEKLDGKELRQLAIEISSSSLMDETREFVRNLKTFGREIKR